MSLKRVAFQGVKWTTIGTVGRALFQLTQVAILTRFLPQEAFGLVAMVLFLVQFSYIFIDMGMTSAILHHQNATKKEYSSIYWFNIFISLVLYGALFFCAPFIADFYNEPKLYVLIPILGLNLVLLAIGRQHRTIMQKQFKFKAITIIELISFFIGLFAATLFAVNAFGVYSLVYSTLIASFVANVLFLFQNLKLNPINFYFKFNEVRSFLRVGGYNMGSQFVGFFSREIDILIIGKLLGADSLGLYTLSKQIVLKLYSVFNPIVVNVLSPLLSSIQDNKGKIREVYSKIVRLLALSNFPVFLLIAVLSKEILTIVYGKDYAQGYLVLTFLALAYVLSSINNPVGSLQIATGRTDIGLKWTIFRVLITPLVVYITATISVNAVAIGLAVLSVLLIFPFWLIQLKPMLGISFREYINYFFKPYLIVVLITITFIVFQSGIFISMPIILIILIKSLLAISSFVLVLAWFDRRAYKEGFKFVSNLINKKS